MKLLYRIKLRYLQLKQWFLKKFKKDYEDNIYPFW
jgi:hypothetical protein